MTHSRIRDTFYRFFSERGHQRVLSSPLVPAKDPTLLFTNAGMNQFKGVFLQEEQRDYRRAVTIQKCMRVSGKHNDFDEVGKTDFHHTFFEMLGNFSFGDYFKEKAIEFAWELLTKEFALPMERLWITVFRDDDEASRIWEKIGVPDGRILRRDEKDNFWQMGDTGPCGPCSEIHYDRGNSFGPPDFVDGNRRFVEIWNLVFMQFIRNGSGKMSRLPAPSIDTGMGLERLAAVLQSVPSNYETDLFQPIFELLSDLSGRSLKDSYQSVDCKVIADHSRALSFLISDGVIPSNEGRGYVLRRILRRAIKHGRSLSLKKDFLESSCSKVIEIMSPVYPELLHNRDFIRKILHSEEERFQHTLDSGFQRFLELMAETKQNNQENIPGKELFKLSDTYGFPIDFARDLAIEQGLGIDFEGFRSEMDSQRERSRQSLTEKRKETMSLKDIERFQVRFLGDEDYEAETEVLAIYVDNRPVGEIGEKQSGILVVGETPFYAESGGQVGDTGSGKSDRAFFNVRDTKKVNSGAILHYIDVEKGVLRTGDRVRLEVDRRRRQNVAAHHSVTHLLHAALREALGLHVKQSGSHVSPDKLRFDFTHYQALTAAEIEQIEDIVNGKIRENLPVHRRICGYEEALKTGAMAIFEEKYGDTVRVISMGDFSMELCGGTHVESTGEIGVFKITGESSVSSGIRRIEAVAGHAGFSLFQRNFKTLAAIATHFNQKPEGVVDFLKNADARLRDREREIRKISSVQAQVDLDALIGQATVRQSPIVVIDYIENADPKKLSALADEIKAKTGGIAILFSNGDEKSHIAVSVHRDLTKKYDANIMIRKVATMVNGKGGGRSDFAQAGGERIVQIPEFKRRIAEWFHHSCMNTRLAIIFCVIGSMCLSGTRLVGGIIIKQDKNGRLVFTNSIDSRI